MIRALATAAVLGALAGCALAGCGPAGEEDGVDATEANAALEQQRTDVRAVARVLLAGSEEALPGRTTAAAGGWRGCESASEDAYRSFRYLAQFRVDAGPGAASPYLPRLAAGLEGAGLTPGHVRPGPGARTTLAGDGHGLTAAFSHTGGAFVGLDVYGPCVEVAEQDRDRWLRRREPSPDLR